MHLVHFGRKSFEVLEITLKYSQNLFLNRSRCKSQRHLLRALTIPMRFSIVVKSRTGFMNLRDLDSFVLKVKLCAHMKENCYNF